MSFNKAEWKLFTCDSLFEPAVFSSHGGIDKEKHIELQSMISLPGMKSPEDFSTPTSGTALMKTFISVTSDLFVDKQTIINLVEIPKEFVVRMKETLETQNEDGYVKFILSWVENNENEIENVVRHSTEVTVLSSLIASLLAHAERLGNPES